MDLVPLSAYAKPGLMLSQIWPKARNTEGETLRGFEAALEWTCFEIFHMVDIRFPAERAAVGRIVRERNLDVTYGLSRVANHGGLNLSSLDDSARQQAVQEHAAAFDVARQIGARYVQVNSGPAPEFPGYREEALNCLGDALRTLAHAAAPELQLLIEPLDVAIHKKGTLGYAPEAISLCESVPGLGICVDTAHMTLNGEDILGLLPALRPHTREFHFCNCVITPGHPLHGDHHVPFGPPGALGIAEVGRIMAEGVRAGLFQRQNRPRVFCEVRRTEGQSAEDVIRHSWSVLESGWETAGVS